MNARPCLLYAPFRLLGLLRLLLTAMGLKLFRGQPLRLAPPSLPTFKNQGSSFTVSLSCGYLFFSTISDLRESCKCHAFIPSILLLLALVSDSRLPSSGERGYWVVLLKLVCVRRGRRNSITHRVRMWKLEPQDFRWLLRLALEVKLQYFLPVVSMSTRRPRGYSSSPALLKQFCSFNTLPIVRLGIL